MSVMALCLLQAFSILGCTGPCYHVFLILEVGPASLVSSRFTWVDSTRGMILTMAKEDIGVLSMLARTYVILPDCTSPMWATVAPALCSFKKVMVVPIFFFGFRYLLSRS